MWILWTLAVIGAWFTAAVVVTCLYASWLVRAGRR